MYRECGGNFICFGDFNDTNQEGEKMGVIGGLLVNLRGVGKLLRPITFWTLDFRVTSLLGRMGEEERKIFNAGLIGFLLITLFWSCFPFRR